MRADPVEVQRLYRAGEKLDAIGARFGVTKQRIHQIVRALGEPTRVRPRKARERRITPYGNVRHAERNRRVIEGRAAGDTFSVIAEREGLTVGAAKAIFARWGRP